MVGARVAVPAGELVGCVVDDCVCVGDVEEEVKRWSGGEKSGGAWAHGWHLGRVLKVGISGAGAAAAKMPPDRCSWGKGRGKLTRCGQKG